MGLNWLITGGCGFIGRRLIRTLIAAESGHQIRVVDDLSVGTRDALASITELSEAILGSPPRSVCELIVGNILDAPLAISACAGIDVVVHLAANTGVGPSVKNPRADCMNNVIGVFNYLEAARHQQVGRFVFASSGAPIGEREPPLHEELAARPESPYGASKLAGEGYCSAYFRTFGLTTVALRFGNVFGPGSDHKNSVVAAFVRQAIAGETLKVFGDGGQTRDFIFVDDLVEAILRAATRLDVGGEVFQIATSLETSLTELLAQLIPVLENAGVPPPQVVFGPERLGDVRRNYSDTSKAQRMLDWQSKTSLSDGLRLTIADFLGQSG